MNFQIDDAYLSSITIRREWGLYDNIPQDQLTHEQLINILKGKDRCSSVTTDDHPEFSKFRDRLEADGYIRKGPKWNGDLAIKSFSVNGYRFDNGDKFFCAAALHNSIVVQRKILAKSVGSTV